MLPREFGLHRLCHACGDPVAVLSVPQGALLDANRSFRELARIPDPLPPDLTIMSLSGPAVGRTLRSWSGTGSRVIRKAVLGGAQGQARLLAIPATFPVQAFFHFVPARSDSPLQQNKLQDLLDQRLQQIRTLERLGSLGELAAVMVHEFRTPLTSIRLGVEGARRSPLLAEGLRARLDLVLRQVDHLERLLQSIRRFMHPDRLAREWVDVRATISKALETAEAPLRGAAITVEVHVRPDPLRILGDPDTLTEAIQNLVVNAVEAMPQGGTIRILASPQPGNPGWMELAVSDDGIGIPADLLGRMFQPFFTTKRTGTGLGLSIVKKIAELHGGEVSLRSAVGKGTTVLLNLPLGSST